MLSSSNPARVEKTRSRTRSRLGANAGHDEGPLHSALVHASRQTRTWVVIEIRDPNKFHSARPGRVGDSHRMAVGPVVLLNRPHQREGRGVTIRNRGGSPRNRHCLTPHLLLFARIDRLFFIAYQFQIEWRDVYYTTRPRRHRHFKPSPPWSYI